MSSELFDRIIVSTDDPEVANVAISTGAEVPFMRPASLADDFTGTTEVIAHATEWATAQGWQVSAVCCIYATSPLLRSEDLSRGLSALKSGKWNYAFSATEFASTVFRAMRWMPEGGVQMIFPEHAQTRSQDLPITLHDAGQFYWGTTGAWLAKAGIFSESSIPVLIPRTRSQDIDSEEDWIRAESLFNLSMGHAIKGI
jgi:N-acylneuraminate cytidylyltransferase